MARKSSLDLAGYDRQFRKDGVTLLAGVDEAGRGPLAGPVV
ncbi:MAG: ribonuclease HII, partial [Candidatus Edwardsbacteria bacterium]|nr:ribonuclease HII [Candidatus Edwardsbacteria bacterium]